MSVVLIGPNSPAGSTADMMGAEYPLPNYPGVNLIFTALTLYVLQSCYNCENCWVENPKFSALKAVGFPAYLVS